jgi:hypothetical protein
MKGFKLCCPAHLFPNTPRTLIAIPALAGLVGPIQENISSFCRKCPPFPSYTGSMVGAYLFIFRLWFFTLGQQASQYNKNPACWPGKGFSQYHTEAEFMNVQLH